MCAWDKLWILPSIYFVSQCVQQFSRMKVKVKLLSHLRLFATPWTIAYQAPLFIGFSRQEYWSGFPFPSPGDLPNPAIEPRSPALQANGGSIIKKEFSEEVTFQQRSESWEGVDSLQNSKHPLWLEQDLKRIDW